MPSKKIAVSKKHIFANRTTSTQWNFIVVAFHFWKVKVSFMSSFSVNIISVDFWEQIWSRPLNLSRNLERFASRNYFNCVLHHQIYVMSSGQLSFQKVEHTVHTHTLMITLKSTAFPQGSFKRHAWMHQKGVVLLYKRNTVLTPFKYLAFLKTQAALS